MISRPASSPAGAFLSAEDRRSLRGYGAAIAVLHVLGWGLCLFHTRTHPALLGLGLAAYLLGLRHAFDADHIAAIDDTVRLMLHNKRGPLGVGFFFSLGHSTVVCVLAVVAGLLSMLVQQHLPGVRCFGNVVGTLVSGVFLWGIGLLNLAVLLDMLHLWHRWHEAHVHSRLEHLLARRGILNRLFGRRLTRLVEHSWQMYPVGLLFGLGFDTASEIALLTLAGGAAVSRAPIGAVLALPILFTAAMSLMDTADGVLMTRAYGWAFFDPVRRIFYNLATTSLSVAVALLTGTLEIAQLLVRELHLGGAMARALAGLPMGLFGYGIAALFVLAWGASFLAWRLRAAGARDGRCPPLAGTQQMRGS